MLEELRIMGFRRYDNLNLRNLGKINFILGENNVGKTTILEAVFTWACGQNMPPMIGIPLARGRYGGLQNLPYWEMEELLAVIHDKNTVPFHMRFEGTVNGRKESFSHRIVPSDLLSDYDVSYKDKNVEFVSKTNNSGYYGTMDIRQAQMMNPVNAITIAEWFISHNDNDEKKTILTAPNTYISDIKPFCNAKYIDVLSQTGIQETAQIYAALKRERLIEQVAAEMKKIYPDIDGFDMIPYPDGSQAPVSIIKKDGSFLPLYAYGDGVQRWFYIMGCLALYRDSIICIDEIDSGFHPRAQKEFCRRLIEGAFKYNAQLFITTHNLEFLDNFLMAAQDADSPEKIKILSLKEVDQSVSIRNLDAREAYYARNNFDMEMRG